MDISAFTFRFSKKLFFRTWCTPQMQLSIKPNRSTYTHNGKFFTIYCEFGELFSGGNPHPILFVSTSLTGIQSGFAPILFIHFMVFIHGTASTRQMKKTLPEPNRLSRHKSFSDVCCPRVGRYKPIMNQNNAHKHTHTHIHTESENCPTLQLAIFFVYAPAL